MKVFINCLLYSLILEIILHNHVQPMEKLCKYDMSVVIPCHASHVTHSHCDTQVFDTSQYSNIYSAHYCSKYLSLLSFQDPYTTSHMHSRSAVYSRSQQGFGYLKASEDDHITTCFVP